MPPRRTRPCQAASSRSSATRRAILTSSICAAVSAKELTSAAQMIDAETFRSFEVYFTAAGIYLVMSWSLMMTLSFIERKFIAYPVR